MADYSHLMGWHRDDRAVEIALSELTIPNISYATGITGSGAGKTVLLYQYLTKLVGKFNVRLQVIGDCQNPTDLVRMADGTEKQIVDVQAGDKVLTPMGNIRSVISTIAKPYTGHMVSIVVDGAKISSTPDHKYLTRSGWKAIENLSLNDEVWYKGGFLKISSRDIVQPDTDKVYCIEVEEDHAFICNGYGVHNCVSMGAACGVDVLRCVQHYVLGTGEQWIAECATEPIYAGSRVEIAGGQLGGGDGSNGIWAAKWVKQYGILLRQKYGDIDLTTYSGQRARQWGMPRAGVPDVLEPIAKLHPVKQYTQVRTWEEARDALANGYPVTIASGAGFSSTRDKDGFARPAGSWAHQMCLIAVKDDGRPGALINNSWGPNWIGGPKGEFDIPDGSFWCDAAVLERNILSAGDSWAFSNFESFPPQKLDLRLV